MPGMIDLVWISVVSGWFVGCFARWLTLFLFICSIVSLSGIVADAARESFAMEGGVM